MIVYAYTALIRVADLSYPKYLDDVKREFTNISFPQLPDESLVEPFGYFLIRQVERPSGDVVDLGPPALNSEDGHWYWTWTVRDFTPEEVAENLKNAKDSLASSATSVLTTDLETGIPYPVGSDTFQVRIKPSDLTLLLSVNNIVSASSDPDEVYPFRFMDGYKSDFTAGEMKQVVLDITSRQYETTKKYWAFLNTIDTVTVITDLPELPVTFLD